MNGDPYTGDPKAAWVIPSCREGGSDALDALLKPKEAARLAPLSTAPRGDALDSLLGPKTATTLLPRKLEAGGWGCWKVLEDVGRWKMLEDVGISINFLDVGSFWEFCWEMEVLRPWLRVVEFQQLLGRSLRVGADLLSFQRGSLKMSCNTLIVSNQPLSCLYPLGYN